MNHKVQNVEELCRDAEYLYTTVVCGTTNGADEMLGDLQQAVEVLKSNWKAADAGVNNNASNNTSVAVPESSLNSNYKVPTVLVETSTTVGTGADNSNVEIEVLDEPIPKTNTIGLSTGPDSTADYNDVYEEPTERDIIVEIPASSDSTITKTTTKKNIFSKYVVPGIAGTAVVVAAVTYGA